MLGVIEAAKSGRFNGKFGYLSVICPKCFVFFFKYYFSTFYIEIPHSK